MVKVCGFRHAVRWRFLALDREAFSIYGLFHDLKELL